MIVIKRTLTALMKRKIYSLILLLFFIAFAWLFLVCFAIYDAANAVKEFVSFPFLSLNNAFGDVAERIGNISSAAITAIIIAVIIGSIILSLLMMRRYRTRKVDIDELLPGEEEKLRIITQLIVEVLLIASLAFGVAVFGGNYIVQSIGKTLIQNGIISIQNNENERIDSGSLALSNRIKNAIRDKHQNSIPGDVRNRKPINVKISLNGIGQAAAAEVIIIMISTAATSFAIVCKKRWQDDGIR